MLQKSRNTKKGIRRMNFRLTLEGRRGPRSRGRSPSIRPATTELRPQHHPSTAWAWKTLSKNARAYRGRVRTTGNPPRLTTAGAARSGAAATTTTRWMGRGGRFLEATRRRPDDGAMVVMSARRADAQTTAVETGGATAAEMAWADRLLRAPRFSLPLGLFIWRGGIGQTTKRWSPKYARCRWRNSRFHSTDNSELDDHLKQRK